MRTKTTTLLMALATAAGLSACPQKDNKLATPDEVARDPALAGIVILDWSAHTEHALVVDSKNIDPLPATRTLAMVHVAMHDAINAARPRFAMYAYRARDAGADPIAAAAAAAHRVLVQQFPAQAADLDARLKASLAAVPDGDAEERGVALGAEVGAFFFDRRAHDGAAATIAYTPGTGPGAYQFVPPFEGFINRPGWRAVTPWTLRAADQFRSPPPPALASAAYAAAYREVKQSGAKAGSDRTADETRYAKFWYENSDTGWNRITRVVAEDKQLDLHASARLFALVNMAMADGFIAGWDAKFHHDFWRPYTAISAGATDGNEATAPDAAWEPLLPTPPVQDYPSTHSVLGAAAATVLARVVGDETRFIVTSGSAEQPMVETRSFESFRAAARENGDSRVQAGLHFRFAVDAGLTMGEQIGAQAVDELLLPL
jgi:hypothetical protein